MNPAYIRIVMSLIQSSHNVLDALLQMENSTYRKCPTVTTIRALYAIQGLWALGKSINRQPAHLFFHHRGSPVSKVLHPADASFS